MTIVAAILLLQQAVAPPRQVPPALQLPEPGIDDPAAYQGYRTRFYQDARDNTLQIYLSQRDGRVVGVWGNAANESLGFTVRDAAGDPARLDWGADSAAVESRDRRRSVEFRLVANAPAIEVGRFLLGSMRVERDFQYLGGHREPFGSPPFPRPELTALIANLERLDAPERQRHLALLGARDVAELRDRLRPTVALDSTSTETRVRVEQPSFDGRNRLALELRVHRRDAEVVLAGDAVSIRSRSGGPIPLGVRVSTDAEPLTPLRYTEIFNEPFLRYYDGLRAERDRVLGVPEAERSAAEREHLLRVARTERQVRSLELLSSREKLMAGLPNYGTYFGRDMLMTALMMEPVWTDRMAENVIASVLRKLAPTGEVSHEEALGGQAIREHAGIYNELMEDFFRQRGRAEGAADSSLTRARRVLSDLQAVRENYHMMDDDFQFPVLVARYLASPDVPLERRRAFLLAPAGIESGATRLELLLRNLSYVAGMAEPYARDPVATNLIAFPPRTETAWFPGSWRDSNIGYANGRFAMDINVVWVPAALRSLGTIAGALREMGYDAQRLGTVAPEAGDSPLGEYLARPAALSRSIQTWRGAARHFAVSLSPAQIRHRVQAKLAWMPEEERAYWSEVFQRARPVEDLRFLALSLDAAGRPVPVVNTDVATRLFVQELAIEDADGALTPEQVLSHVRSVLLPYPAGLFIPGIGPVVANDAYAGPEVWEAFQRDHYHSPRVVWGREVNLLLLGLTKQLEAVIDSDGAARRPELAPYAEVLRQALRQTRQAVEASGLKDQELWSYRIEDGRLLPVRYAASTDIQLWNLTDLAVQYELARLAGVRAGPRN